MRTYEPTDIVDSIVNAPISPSAREIASDLVEAWIEENGEFDSQYDTLAVEAPWFYWLDAHTLLVGVMDRIAKDEKSLFGCEWKSVKEPTKNKDGSDSAWWNENTWLQGISTGTQLAIYGLALSRGVFVLPNRRWQPKIKNPRIMVRAAVKSSPVVFWPTRREDGMFSFPEIYLDKVAGALKSKATQIRAAKSLKIFPWALPGNHCTNRFRKLCPYYEDMCVKGKHPAGKPATLFDESDPGSAAIQATGVKAGDINNPNLVIFSASSYDTSQQCVERYRIMTGGYVQKDADPNLEIGTGMHTGLAAYYQQHGCEHSGPRENKSERLTTKRLDKPKRQR